MLFSFQNNSLVKIENGMSSFKEFQANFFSATVSSMSDKISLLKPKAESTSKAGMPDSTKIVVSAMPLMLAVNT